jgi:hypothetical protein
MLLFLVVLAWDDAMLAVKLSFAKLLPGEKPVVV